MSWLTTTVILLILTSIFALYIMLNKKNDKVSEGFWGDSGQFCTTCTSRTPNQCLSCFNCGLAYDRYGNSACIGGSVHGPFNYESARWYHGGAINPNDIIYWKHGDPYSYMIQRNANYNCSMGPRSSNRIIGV